MKKQRSCWSLDLLGKSNSQLVIQGCESEKELKKMEDVSDFMDLSKAYPKDSYTMSRYDELINNASGYQYLSFTIAYLGYNQIWVHPEDEQNIAFITEEVNFLLQSNAFWIKKNAGATNWCLMSKVFKETNWKKHNSLCG